MNKSIIKTTKIESAFLDKDQAAKIQNESEYLFGIPLGDYKLSVWRLYDVNTKNTLSIGVNAFASVSGTKEIKTVYKIKISTRSHVKTVYYPKQNCENTSVVNEFDHDDDIFATLAEQFKDYIKQNSK